MRKVVTADSLSVLETIFTSDGGFEVVSTDTADVEGVVGSGVTWFGKCCWYFSGFLELNSEIAT